MREEITLEPIDALIKIEALAAAAAHLTDDEYERALGNEVIGVIESTAKKA
ncbi:hypothetical protein [Sodalis glossinidius]|uniref:hypothetical protein n=1 Tax=Sodalis glossinidius TaxID=63612 RepID=UPI000306CB5E|nr:hypothetical protein [Sodalis glossinidius]